MRTAWVNGRFGGGIDGYDAGMLGHGVFETVGVFAGAMPLWEAHLSRLAYDAAVLGIPCAPRGDLRDIADELRRRNEASTGEPQDVLRMTLTAGVDGEPTWCLTTRPRGAPVPVRLHPVPFLPPETAAIKTTSRACYLLPLRAALAAGSTEALLVDAAGSVLETTTGNVLVRTGGRWRTPPLDGRILPGVARAALLAAMRESGIPVDEERIDGATLAEGDALCVTNAVWGARPATVAGGQPAAELDTAVRAAWHRVVS